MNKQEELELLKSVLSKMELIPESMRSRNYTEFRNEIANRINKLIDC